MRFWFRQFRFYQGACIIWAAAAFLGIPSSTNAATITGEAKFLGTLANDQTIRVSKDQDYCGETLPNEKYLIGPGQALKNVVVFIEGLTNGSGPIHEARENFLENSGCRMAPRVLAMRWGEKLIIKNNDPKLHIVHAYLDKRTVFNMALPFQGTKMDITRKIKSPGLLQLNCDTHAWMRGYIHVFGHSYFAVTDEHGVFSIENIPPGKYTLKAWHEEAGVESREVVVGDEGEIKVHWEFGR